MSTFITGILIIVSLIVGFGTKIFFGGVIGEKSQDIIDKVVKSTTGIDLDPIFDLDNEDKK